MTKKKKTTTSRRSAKKAAQSSSTTFLRIELPVEHWSMIPVPGSPGQFRGDCYIPIKALAGLGIENWLDVNPRTPPRDTHGRLKGPMVPRIMESAVEQPEKFVDRSRGITFSAHSASHEKGVLYIEFRRREHHGVLDGATSSLTLMEVLHGIEQGDINADLSNAYIHLTVLVGVPDDRIADIAESLNRSQQVDTTSLNTMRGIYDSLGEAMLGHPGEDQINYYTGGPGSLRVAWVAAILELFNGLRFDRARLQPATFARRVTSAEAVYTQDLYADPSPVAALLPMLPSILRLYDLVRLRLPMAWDHVEDKAGRKYAKQGGADGKKYGAGREDLYFLTPNDLKLPGLLISKTRKTQAPHTVPRGFLFPVLAAFRANTNWDPTNTTCNWTLPLRIELIDEVLAACVPHLISQVASKVKPEDIGKNAEVYKACYQACAAIVQAHQHPNGAGGGEPSSKRKTTSRRSNGMSSLSASPA